MARTKGSKNGKTVMQIRDIYKGGNTEDHCDDRHGCEEWQRHLEAAHKFLAAYLKFTKDFDGRWEFKDPIVCRTLFGQDKRRLVDRDVKNNRDAILVLDRCIRGLKKARNRMAKW